MRTKIAFAPALERIHQYLSFSWKVIWALIEKHLFTKRLIFIRMIAFIGDRECDFSLLNNGFLPDLFIYKNKLGIAFNLESIDSQNHKKSRHKKLFLAPLKNYQQKFYFSRKQQKAQIEKLSQVWLLIAPTQSPRINHKFATISRKLPSQSRKQTFQTLFRSPEKQISPL